MFDPPKSAQNAVFSQYAKRQSVFLRQSVMIFTAIALVSALGPESARAANFSSPPPSDRQTPSGLPVPRYVSLKYANANARSGPGDDNRLLWVFRVRGLPVQVIAETAEWRRICDPDGGLSWVHKRLTDGRRMAMSLRPKTLAIQKQPKAASPVVAYLNPRALAVLERCDQEWCKIKVDKVQGWVPSAQIWGTDERPQCHAGL